MNAIAPVPATRWSLPAPAPCQHPRIARTHLGAGLHAVVCNDCLHAWWQFGVSSLETAPSCVASGLES